MRIVIAATVACTFVAMLSAGDLSRSPEETDVIVALTPSAVVEEFVRLDGAGAQASRAGLQTLAPFFAQPMPTSPPAIAVIMRDVVVGHAMIHGDDRADVMIQSVVLFELNLETGRVDAAGYPPGGIKVRTNVTLVLTRDGGRPRWIFEGRLPMPHLTIDGALSHVRRLRATTKDPRITKQATSAIAALERQR